MFDRDVIIEGAIPTESYYVMFAATAAGTLNEGYTSWVEVNDGVGTVHDAGNNPYQSIVGMQYACDYGWGDGRINLEGRSITTAPPAA